MLKSAELEDWLQNKPALLSGPLYTGKGAILNQLRRSAGHVASLDFGSLANVQGEKRRAQLQERYNEKLAELDDAGGPKLLILDELEHLLDEPELLPELLSRRPATDRWLFVANVPESLIDFDRLELDRHRALDLTFAERWKQEPLANLVQRAGEDEAAVLRSFLGEHPYLGRLALEFTLEQKLRITTDLAAMERGWRELVNGPLRAFFEERSRDIVQNAELFAGCRALFAQSKLGEARWGCASPKAKAAYRWLVKWGIAKAVGKGDDLTIRPNGTLFRLWLHTDFASDLP